MGFARMQAAAFAALLYKFWYAPLEYVPQEIVQPMTSRSSFPWSYKGTEHEPTKAMAAVGMIGWVFLCDRTAAGLVSAVDSIVSL